MNLTPTEGLSVILNALLNPYIERVPDVRTITDAMVASGMIKNADEVVNDHIAFRTLGVSNLGLQSLEKIFLHHGYRKMDAYHFVEKKLNAYWYAPPQEHFPRIFLSELRVNDLSIQAQQIIKKYTDPIKTDPVDELDLNDVEAVCYFFHQSLWELPILEDYQLLLQESEYAAWVIYNRYYLNHYTISVHELKDGYQHLEKFNEFLESIGIRLNTAGGIIKTSRDGLLKQSSSVAKMIPATFADGKTIEIAGSYVEFAERLPLPEFQHLPLNTIKREHRREGFETGNADKIFESTYTGQTKQ